MKAALCLKSEAVVKAFRTGQWPDSLRAHIESCECCRETFRGGFGDGADGGAH